MCIIQNQSQKHSVKLIYKKKNKFIHNLPTLGHEFALHEEEIENPGEIIGVEDGVEDEDGESWVYPWIIGRFGIKNGDFGGLRFCFDMLIKV